jgi:hypothetical protein
MLFPPVFPRRSGFDGRAGDHFVFDFLAFYFSGGPAALVADEDAFVI